MRTNTNNHQRNVIALARTIGIALIAMTAAATAKGQTFTKDQDGNYRPTTQQTAAHDSITGSSIAWDGKRHEPIYVGKQGGLYLARTSKSGKYYRKYIKTEN